jgi:ribonucleotide reductase alpha subunit
MGRDPAGIFSTLRTAALIQQTGGGNGFSFSRLRPRGARVSTSKGLATGPVGFLRVYDKAFGEIAQGGTRRGANMAVLRVDHPDIMDFIRCKGEEGDIANFNISVGITDGFMHAVESDVEYDLINPQDGAAWKRVRAREAVQASYAARALSAACGCGDGSCCTPGLVALWPIMLLKWRRAARGEKAAGMPDGPVRAMQLRMPGCPL